jgi:hypothetical protein
MRVRSLFERRHELSANGGEHLGSLFISPCLLFIALALLGPTVVCAQWEPDRKLSTTDSAACTNENMARCIIACADTLHVVWWDWQNKGSAIYYKRSSDQGATWTADTRISGTPGTADFPSLAQSGSTLHLVFRDDRTGEYGSYYKRSLDGGRTWESDILLGIEHWWPSVAAVESMVYVALNDNIDSTNSEVFFRRSTNNGTSWDSTQRISNATGRSEDPCITAGGPYVHIVWNEFRDGNCEVYYRHSSDQGMTWGPETRLTNAPNHSYSPNIVASGSNADIAWEDRRSGDYDIYFKRSTDHGLGWGPDERLTQDTVTSLYPSFAVAGSNINMVWFDIGGGVLYMHSSDGGASWDPERTLVSGFSSPGMPFIAVSGSALHVIWTDKRDGHSAIYYKRNLNGNPGVSEDPPRAGDHIHRDLPLSVIPNPFASFTTVPGHEEGTFSVYDICGRKAGEYKGGQVGTCLSAGLYFLKPEGEGGRPVRIVKVK